jgi:hypothetical protein
MDILEAIDMLEAVGFHMYRRILYNGKQVGAALVYTPIDLYCRLIFDGGITFLDIGRGEWEDVDGLKDDLPTLLMQFAEEMDTPKPVASEFVAAPESVFPEKLAETEKEAGRKLDFLWEGCNGYWIGIYRGAVLEINNDLRVISLDGGEIKLQKTCFGYHDADSQTGMSLPEAFAVIDTRGGCEEIQLEALVGTG